MKRLFNNTLFTSIDYFVLVVLNLLATPILIKNFGIDGYGAFVFLSIFSIYGALSFFDLGMEGSIMNYVARFDAASEKKQLQDTLSISICFYALLGLLVASALYLAGDFITSRLIDQNAVMSRSVILTSISIISMNIFLQFITLPFIAVLQGLRRFVITKGINSLMNILRYLLIIIAAIIYHRIDIAFWIILGLTSLRLLVLVFIFIFKLPQFRHMQVSFNPSLLKILFSYSSILFVNRLVGLLCNQVDKLLIWLYMAISNMTIYDVISRPANLLRLVLSIINSAVVPEIARLHHLNDLAAIQKIYLNLVRYAYLVILPIIALLYVYVGDLLEIWVGQEFVAYSYLSLILLSVYLILPIPSIASTMVVGLEKVKQTIWIPVVSTIINLTLSFFLLNKIGLAGLLVATVCGELFAVYPYLRAMRKFLKYDISRLISPLYKIFALASLAVLCHAVIRAIIPGQPILAASFGMIVFILNLYANYRYLLDDNEKLFLTDRIRVIANRLSAGANRQ